MAEFLPHHYHKVLEIGCGEGGFAACLNAGCEIWGVEMHESSASIASQRIHRILIGSYDAVQQDLPENYFDLVICNDVIEHMPDHDAFFDSIGGKLRDGGYLVASIPNMRYYYCLRELLLRKEWVYRDQGVMDRTHLRFFTERSIRRTLSDHGFSVESLRGINGLRGAKRVLRAMFFVVLTLGYYSDILFQQFGFRAINRRNARTGDSGASTERTHA
jgi:2-polyprenyl-3-methyl-5-hydroxy-6-metoxy-1,4-benzoquinol methylase